MRSKSSIVPNIGLIALKKINFHDCAGHCQVALVQYYLGWLYYPPIVRDVIAKVRHGRGKDGGDPQGIHAKGWEVFQGRSQS